MILRSAVTPASPSCSHPPQGALSLPISYWTRSEQRYLRLMSLTFIPVGGPTGMKTSRDFGLKVSLQLPFINPSLARSSGIT
jgi:hypothetical protein